MMLNQMTQDKTQRLLLNGFEEYWQSILWPLLNDINEEDYSGRGDIVKAIAKNAWIASKKQVIEKGLADEPTR